MSELRFDPLQRRWVIVAPERALRPQDLAQSRPEPPTTSCPLCAGNERYTAGEIFALRNPGSGANGPGWRVRVVPNKYPVLRVEASAERTGDGVYDRVAGVGAHEVIIETPDHDRTMGDLSVEELRDVLFAYRARLTDLSRDMRLRYLLLFKNHGSEAGARLDHSHSQIIAIPEIPDRIGTQLCAAREHYASKERCLLCDILRQELEQHDRLVLEGSRFVAFVPYAAALPFEMMLCPRNHGHDFTAQSDEDLLHLASALRDALRRLGRVLDHPPYNLALHAAPPPHPRPGRFGSWESLSLDWHWYIAIAPRLMRVAGFEWSSGFHINPVLPEDAARYLREVEAG